MISAPVDDEDDEEGFELYVKSLKRVFYEEERTV